MHLKDNIALVTGGVRGIGDAISKKFLEHGAHVIAVARNEERNNKWANALKEQGFDKVTTFACDVSNFEECQNMVAKIKEQHGKVDILINNAGITKDVSFKKMAKEDWDSVMKIDLDSIFNMTRPVLDMMLANGYGRIINMSSVNAQKGQFGQTNYAAAKAGMHGFTKALALETARKNITVNTISPGYIDTDMMKGIPEDIMGKIVAQIPVGRLGTAEEIADLTAFLASKGAGYITGADLSINGGLHME